MLILLIIAIISISVVLLWPLRFEESRELQQENVWYPSEDGVHEHRYNLFLSKDYMWVKEFECRKRTTNAAPDNV